MLALLYRCLTDIGAPFIRLYLQKRLVAGREDAARFHERLGVAGRDRPAGRLIWCHAASVGEATSLLALIEKLRAEPSSLQILVTTGTVTSARMLLDRLPPGVVHQYVPVDRMSYVTRFLDYWQPDLVLWIESEIWPNMLSALGQRKVPTVLLNGRMSEKSFRYWLFVKTWASDILSTFTLCLTQTEAERERFSALGARNVRCFGNLKYAAKPLPYDPIQLEDLKKKIGTRPVWLLASSHEGEEIIAWRAHQKLVQRWPQLLTIIVPRHAVRGDALVRDLKDAQPGVARRSLAEPLLPLTALYLVDTMGELGLFFRLSPITVMGGSLVPVGGHNPIEPAQIGAAIVVGPYMYNFSAITEEFCADGAMIRLEKTEDLIDRLDFLFSHPSEQKLMGEAAKKLAQDKSHILDQIMDELRPWLSPPIVRES